MKSKSQKKEELSKLKDKLPKSQLTIFTAFSPVGQKGLSVAQMRQLKRALREAEADYLITKKTIMDRVFGTQYDGLDIFGMGGSLGLVLGYGDPYAVAKKAYEFSRKNEALKFFGAIFEDGFITQEQFLEIARMPSREMLLTRLVVMMQYPIRGLAVVLNEIVKQKTA